MCYSAVLAITAFIFTNINADSSEDPQSFTYYAPPTLNFHDIYANNLALLTEDSTISSLLDDDSYHLKNVPAQFVEFQTQAITVPTVTSASLKSLLTTTLLKNTTKPINSSLATTTSTTEEPESPVKVIPIEKKGTKYQRGVLDLLFPATRVKNFKSVFDTVRRLLSHTF